ncbi:hypothetical protein PHYSODRAFT_293399 [Phytophthora sojae]|uniref:DDE-1 domain-containing protein n=1 Tax=Phytophthora sojae (strain P6497) TaxID=1094619 RepID=G4YF06_PHYSP|nr:hypothetical protein PHYSODRAFT_293399 [Phytophthora sojae]EGZ27589.1 hypothetical protein PHYSODRAFT_293399 [Phytophthora sojae]|eukprot:XP_009514864.1 hypothetical protein PHYSODRAFT_293399 [Phytophthora sojae]
MALSAETEQKLLAWIRHMRCTKLYCVTTACIRYAHGYFDPDYTATRSLDAPKPYCDQRVMQEWIDDVWSPDVQGPSVLLLDSLNIQHKMECIKTSLEDKGHAKVVYVPPGVTGLAQPMDIAVMKPFKDRCRELYLQFVREGGVFTTPTQKRGRIAAIVTQAWEEVDEESIVNGFLGAGLVAIGPRDANGDFASPEPTREGIVDVE